MLDLLVIISALKRVHYCDASAGSKLNRESALPLPMDCSFIEENKYSGMPKILKLDSSATQAMNAPDFHTPDARSQAQCAYFVLYNQYSLTFTHALFRPAKG